MCMLEAGGGGWGFVTAAMSGTHFPDLFSPRPAVPGLPAPCTRDVDVDVDLIGTLFSAALYQCAEEAVFALEVVEQLPRHASATTLRDRSRR